MKTLLRSSPCAALLLLTAAPALANADFYAAPQPAASPQSAQAALPPSTAGGWALVTKGGKLDRNKNATKANHIGAGQYEIDFNADVRQCGFTGTIAGTPKDLSPGNIVLARRKDTPNGVYVAIYDAVTLLPADRRFTVNVTC
jgi:hypothetical protein